MALSGTHGGSRPGDGEADGARYAVRCGASNSGEGLVVGHRLLRARSGLAYHPLECEVLNATRLQCALILLCLLLMAAHLPRRCEVFNARVRYSMLRACSAP